MHCVLLTSNDSPKKGQRYTRSVIFHDSPKFYKAPFSTESVAPLFLFQSAMYSVSDDKEANDAKEKY